jgi:HD-like signal output (HDOD) protein
VTQSAAASNDPQGSNDAAFTFVQDLASELAQGKLELPSFPDIAARVREVLADENVAPDKVVKVVGSEPALAARLLRVANSSALNPAGRTVTDLRAAVTRLGFNVVRSAAIAFAVSQMKRSAEMKGLEKPLEELWHRCALVAATCHVTARLTRRANAEEAMLCGLLSGVGRIYILSRAKRHPRLFADQATYSSIVTDWHAQIAKAVLENWDMPESIVDAVHGQDDVERAPLTEPDLCDVVIASNVLASFVGQPEAAQEGLQGVKAAQRLALDDKALAKILVESVAEIDALRKALGQ